MQIQLADLGVVPVGRVFDQPAAVEISDLLPSRATQRRDEALQVAGPDKHVSINARPVEAANGFGCWALDVQDVDADLIGDRLDHGMGEMNSQRYWDQRRRACHLKPPTFLVRGADEAAPRGHA